MCVDGDLIIINGGMMMFQMVYLFVVWCMQIFINLFLIVEYFLKNLKNMIMFLGGVFYCEQNIIFSFFENDVMWNFYVKCMFMGV